MALDDDPRVAAILGNLRTIVSVSGAHRGTPLANFFSTIYGKNLLYLITLLVFVGLWRHPIEILGALIRGLGRLNNLLGWDETLLHQLTNQLLRDFNPTVEAEVRAVDAITGQALSWPLTEETSDGVVPTLSQIWGELRGVAQADHLDVVGALSARSV